MRAASAKSLKLQPESPRRNSVLGIISHDTKKHRRNQIFEDGFDFTLASTRKEMEKQQGGFDKTKVTRAPYGAGSGVGCPRRYEASRREVLCRPLLQSFVGKRVGALVHAITAPMCLPCIFETAVFSPRVVSVS